jgi:hypothetical protein
MEECRTDVNAIPFSRERPACYKSIDFLREESSVVSQYIKKSGGVQKSPSLHRPMGRWRCRLEDAGNGISPVRLHVIYGGDSCSTTGEHGYGIHDEFNILDVENTKNDEKRVK